MQIGEVYHKIDVFQKISEASAQPITMEERNQAINETTKQILAEAHEAAAISMETAGINTVPSSFETSPTRIRKRHTIE